MKAGQRHASVARAVAPCPGAVAAVPGYHLGGPTKQKLLAINCPRCSDEAMFSAAAHNPLACPGALSVLSMVKEDAKVSAEPGLRQPRFDLRILVRASDLLQNTPSGNAMQSDLIFDLGMHDGSDTDFYLRKGFRVVAVEADPELIEIAKLRFANAISENKLTLVNMAIADTCGTVKFHRSTNTLWSTVSVQRSAGATRRGAPTVEFEVEATTSTELLKNFGVPYYMKIDIEGLDLTALRGLADIDDRPVCLNRII
jgi:FkbM family methyltransferase